MGGETPLIKGRVKRLPSAPGGQAQARRWGGGEKNQVVAPGLDGVVMNEWTLLHAVPRLPGGGLVYRWARR